MQIFVKSDRTHTVEIKQNATLKSLREAYPYGDDFFTTCGLSCGVDGAKEELFFVFQQLSLRDDVPLREFGVKDGSTIDVHLRLLGGGKKRKKKTYTKPKKPKHKRQHDKLRVLKMYKVDGQKVERLRKQCPKCGAGIFMAMHFDRVYCGKCTLTYLYEREGDE